ncbi:TetR/AcrR family transcriptional regulator [Nocardia sp. NPDC056952]|uniref:TetR/AcrR family transcriptional regulator n=1 Tax=Nocardia sp. NPDC056952 TaxID=3345979 RepID=UPI003627EBD3
MTDTPQLRGERRRMRTRAAILEAAEQLLSDRSTDAVRMEDVAAAAGISPASVYTHFGTKEALVSAVVERLLDMSMTTFTEVFSGEDSALDQVKAAGAAYVRLLLDHPAMTRYLSAATLGQAQTEIDDTVMARIELLRASTEQRMDAAAAAGEIVAVDSRLFSFFLFGAWQGVAALALRHDELRLTPAEIEQCLTQVSRTLVTGLTVFASTPESPGLASDSR